MDRRYVTVDVFTDRAFGGNPLAVVLDAEELTAAQMQAVASEFGYAETTFVLPPRDPAHAAHVRIFTPRSEVPFAGHPNVGTAFVLARAMGHEPDVLTFEEAAGLVPVRIWREGGVVTGAELTAPETLSRRGVVPAERAAGCLGLASGSVRVDAHPPQVISVGLPFLVVELVSRDALRRASADRAAHAALLPLDGADAVYAYTRDVGEDGGDVQARMFAPLDGIAEDPATGSATAALIALRADLERRDDIALRVIQGVDMGRRSLILARVAASGVHVGGQCVAMMQGTLSL